VSEQGLSCVSTESLNLNYFIPWRKGKTLGASQEVKKATAGFIVSLIAGILILINGLLVVAVFAALGDMMSIIPGLEGLEGIMTAIGAIGLIFGILVLIGAILIYMPGKEIIGGILVLVFSILSIFIGGGFFIGMILGIVGGILGIIKK
jgi:hypothetical protein